MTRTTKSLRITLQGFLWVFLTLGTLSAQDLSLEKLRPPTMPSATILGSQINEISRPKSLKGLEMTLLSNFLDSTRNLIVPNDFALEFTPYLLGERKNFNYDTYLDESFGKNFLRNLSFSVASTTNYIIGDSLKSNALGFGVRSRLLNGHISDKANVVKAYKIASQMNLLALKVKTNTRTLIGAFPGDYSIQAVLNFVLENLPSGSFLPDANNPAPTLNANESTAFEVAMKRYLKEVFSEIPIDTKQGDLEDVFTDIYDERITQRSFDELKKQLNNVKTNRSGLIWDLNYASAVNFPSNNFDNAVTSRWGVWSNISFKPEKAGKNVDWTKFEGIFMFRYINNNEDFIEEFNPALIDSDLGNNIDMGLRFVYESKQFSIELEYLKRFNRRKEVIDVGGTEFSRTISNDTKKYVLNVNYNISDNMVISYNIGRGYDIPNVTGNNLISGLSLNFGLGDVKASDLIKLK